MRFHTLAQFLFGHLVTTDRIQPLRVTLIWLVVACMLPVTLMSAAFALAHYRSERARLILNSTNSARALMLAVDNEFRTIDTALQALASSPALVSRDYAAFQLQAKAVLARGFSESIMLVDDTGQQLMNTSAPPSKPLPQIADDALVKTLSRVLSSGKTAVSSLFWGPVQKMPLAMVTVPIIWPTVVTAVTNAENRAPQHHPFVLAGVRLPSRIQTILVDQKLPADWTVSVIDGRGALVARSSGIEQFLGRPVTPDLARMVAQHTDLVSEGVSRDGVPTLLAVTHSTFSDWSVAVGIPMASLNNELRQPLLWVVGLTSGIVLFSLWLAWLIGGRVSASVATLRVSAHALGEGREVRVPRLSFREANVVGDAINKASQTILTTTRALQISEKRMRSILASAKDAIVTFDEAQKIVFFNAAASQMFEWPESDALGMEVMQLMPERYRLPHLANMRAFRDVGQATGKALGLKRSGIEFPVELSYSNVNEAGGVLHTLIARDITARLASARALKRSNHDLEQFAYVASHDLKTPLRSISGFIQLLEKKYAHTFEAAAVSLISRTRDATRRLEQLTDDLLAYARVNSDATAFARVDMQEVAVEVTHLLDAVIQETGAVVTVGSLPAVMGARSQLVQLLLNLVGNGLKYCVSPTPRIQVSAVQDASQWIFSVQDNGIGIEAKHFERIFEVFKRLHAQTEYAGTGIGLAICQRVVHLHGGKIGLHSVQGQGSTFYFTLPHTRDTGVER